MVLGSKGIGVCFLGVERHISEWVKLWTPKSLDSTRNQKTVAPPNNSPPKNDQMAGNGISMNIFEEAITFSITVGVPFSFVTFWGLTCYTTLNPFFQAFGHRCLRSKEALHFQIWLQPSLSPKRRNIHKTSRSAVRRRSVVFSHFCWGLNYLNSPWVPSGRGWSSTQ